MIRKVVTYRNQVLQPSQPRPTSTRLTLPPRPALPHPTQGSLNLAMALHERIDGAGRERSAGVRLTLALRHYGRALSSELLATGSAQMLVCAAEARLELANFYLSWSGEGAKVKHLDTALKHARAALPTGSDDRRSRTDGEDAGIAQGPRADDGGGVGLPAELRVALADAEKRALLELLRAHAAAGNATKAVLLREEYRALLQQE